MSAPLVSVVIPTKNGGARLRQAIDGVRAQITDFETEIVAVDSGSTDGSVEFLGRVATLVRIPPGEFDHGTARNAGIERARGEFVVLLVQDAVPANDRWLAALVEPLRRDGALAAAFARQIPAADASPLTRHYLATWVATSAVPRVAFVESPAAFEALTPWERFDRAAMDNVAAALRRSVWQTIPFRSTPIGEDLEWAREALLAGYGIAYVPDAVVEHSHERSPWYELKRTWTLHQQLHRLFGLRTIPTFRGLVRAMASSLALHRRELSKAQASPGAHVRGAALAVAWPLGQYLGGRTAASRRSAWRSRGV